MVSVVVLHHNRPTWFRPVIESILQQSYAPLEILVVDNRSPATDKIKEMLVDYPQVRLIENSENLGFTGGMNRGIREASGTYVFLTEDDQTLDRDCVARFVDYSAMHDFQGLLSGLIYNKGQGTIRCAGGDITMGFNFELRMRGEGQVDRGQFSEPFPVSYVAGSTIFSRLDFLRRFGGFREEFFIYSDDTELCLRVRRAGLPIVIVPQAKVYHYEPTGGPAPAIMEFRKLKNFYALYLLHAPLYVLPYFFLKFYVYTSVRATLLRRKDPALLAKTWAWTIRKTIPYLYERFTGNGAQPMPGGPSPVKER